MNNFVETYLIANAKFYPTDKIFLVKNKLESITPEREIFIHCLDPKDPLLMLLISFIAGGFGIDRFMLGQTTLGILKLITLGGCGIWAIVDLFLIMEATKEYNFEKLMTLI